MSVMFLKVMKKKRAKGIHLVFVGQMFTFGGINILFFPKLLPSTSYDLTKEDIIN